MHLLSQSHSLYFYFLSFVQNLLATPIEDIGRSQVVQRFVIAFMIIVIDELTNTSLQVTG